MSQNNYLYGAFGNWQDLSTVLQSIMSSCPGLAILVQYSEADHCYHLRIPSTDSLELNTWIMNNVQNVYSPHNIHASCN